MKRFIAILASLSLLIIGNVALAQTTTTLEVVPSKTKVVKGETFTVAIYVNPSVAVAGAQFNLSWNANALTVNSVADGGIFAPSYFMPGTINNSTGTLINVASVIITPGASVAVRGVLATLTCTAKTPGSVSNFSLSNTIVGNKDGIAVPLGPPVVNQLSVADLYDLNGDGTVNLQDLIIVGQAFSTTGVPGWRPEDINVDGKVDILDMILIGQHFS